MDDISLSHGAEVSCVCRESESDSDDFCHKILIWEVHVDIKGASTCVSILPPLPLPSSPSRALWRAPVVSVVAAI